MAGVACVAGMACVTGGGSCMAGGGMHGTRDSHCSGWYASYWNAFFVYQFFVTLLTILYDVPIIPYEWKIKLTTF